MKTSFFLQKKTSYMIRTLSLLLMLLLPSLFADDYTIIEYTTQGKGGAEVVAIRKEKINLAKNRALEYNRPLLLVCSLVTCPNCDTFERNILSKLQSFATENRIVVLATRDDALQTQAFASCRPNTASPGGTPNVYLLKVLRNTVADISAFNSREVEVPALFASEYNSKWTLDSFKALIKSKLPNVSLTSITITGNSSIPTGGTATYTCTATWSDNNTSSVTPTWSLEGENKAYADVSNNGVVTNNNSTTTQKTVTLKASYTDNGTTKTATKFIELAPITLTEIAIEGDDTIPTDGEATYTCKATWSNGTTTTVTPTWRLSDDTFASLSNGTVTNLNTEEVDHTVVLIAAYSGKEARKTITLALKEPEKYHYELLEYSETSQRSEMVLQAKTYAKEKNRPLLLIAARSNNASSQTFKAKIAQTEVFSTFIQSNKIVTLFAEDDALQEKTLSYNYGVQTRGDDAPQVYLFKVLNIDNSDTTAFATDQVVPLTSDNGTFAGTYESEGMLMNIPNGAQSAWNPTTFTTQIEAAFPNQAWSAILPQLVDIDIIGNASIATGYQAPYLCKVTWEDGSVTTENPEWSLDTTAYASLTNDGIVTNNNNTNVEKTVKLTARFTDSGVTKTKTKSITLEPVTLFALAISGGKSIVPKDGATFICLATWSNWTTTEVTPDSWNLDSTTYATVSAGGMVTNKNNTADEKSATLTATYSGATATLPITLASTTSSGEFDYTIIEYTTQGKGGAEVVATRKEKINLAKNRALQYNRPLLLVCSLVTCPNCDTFERNILSKLQSFVTENQIVTLATRDDALQTQTFTFCRPNTASPGGTPNVYLLNVRQNTVADITAFNSREVEIPALFASEYNSSWTLASFKALIKSKLPNQNSVSSIAITGDASIPTGGTATYTCKATWSDKSTSDVTPEWTLSSYTYASVAGNIVRNNNFTTTEQTVTLTASYDGKQATKTIKLAPVTLNALTIEGPTEIASGSMASYVCKATWSNGGSNTVMPDSWSLSSTTYASISAVGIVTNENSTDIQRTVNLTATYSGKNAVKANIVLEPKELLSLTIKGDSTIASGQTATYTCMVNWTYGEDTTADSPAWNIEGENKAYASVNANGVVTNKNNTMEDKQVTLKATFLDENATKTITLAARHLVSIAIVGEANVPNGEDDKTATYTCTATWSYGADSAVVPTWGLVGDNAALASVSVDGVVTNLNDQPEDKDVTLTASYECNGITAEASKDIKLDKVNRVINSIKIVKVEGDDPIADGGSATYTCKVVWSDESETDPEAAPIWSLAPANTEFASVDENGKVTNKNNYHEDKTVTLHASYTVDGKEFTANQSIKLTAISDTACLLTLEPGWNCFGLSFTPDADSLAAIKALGTIWIWDGKAYAEADELTAGMAAFIMSDTTRSETTTIRLTGTTAQPADLTSGWNLVSPQNLPQNAPAFMLDKASNGYILYQDTKKADAACWVFK